MLSFFLNLIPLDKRLKITEVRDKKQLSDHIQLFVNHRNKTRNLIFFSQYYQNLLKTRILFAKEFQILIIILTQRT